MYNTSTTLYIQEGGLGGWVGRKEGIAAFEKKRRG